MISPAGNASSALDWLGERRAMKALTALKQKLPQSTVDELIALRPALPEWMSKSISQPFVSLAPIGTRAIRLSSILIALVRRANLPRNVLGGTMEFQVFSEIPKCSRAQKWHNVTASHWKDWGIALSRAPS
jgi:hypothetical protein